MNREPEHRRDLAPAQPAPNPMGGETYTITETRYVKSWNGSKVAMVSVERNVPFGRNNGW